MGALAVALLQKTRSVRSVVFATKNIIPLAYSPMTAGGAPTVGPDSRTAGPTSRGEAWRMAGQKICEYRQLYRGAGGAETTECIELESTV